MRNIVILFLLLVIILIIAATIGLQTYLTAISAICLLVVFFYLARGLLWSPERYSSIALVAGIIGLLAIFLRELPSNHINFDSAIDVFFSNFSGLFSDFFTTINCPVVYSSNITLRDIGLSGSAIIIAVGISKRFELRRISALIVLFWITLILIAKLYN